MHVTFTNLVLYFTVYSVVGWIYELIRYAITDRQIRNRGFLFGPYLPSYGFGAVLIIWATAPVLQNPWLVFPIILILAALLEYFAGWLLEVLFQLRWWDYTQRRFNLNGRICLRHSLLLSLLGLAAVYGLQPLADRIIGIFDPEMTRVVAALIIVVLVVDLTRTLDALTRLTEKLRNLHLLFKELAERSWLAPDVVNGSVIRLREICAAKQPDPEAARILIRLNSVLKREDAVLRVLAAFPNLISTRFNVEIPDLRIYWTKRRRKWSGRLRRHLRKLLLKTLRLAKDLNPFAQGVSFYKSVWLFVLASVLGFFIETLFCWVTRGFIESRQGMLYGPFSQIYGFGGVLMVLLLNPLLKKPWPMLFLSGAMLGGLYEIGCSLLQEYVIGTVSWSYTEAHIGFAGGRTSLVYMLYWGILAMAYMYLIYPRISAMIDRIPPRQGIFFSWLFVVVLSANLILSGLAVNRWTERQEGLPPAGAFSLFLDQHYADEMMEQIYPRMLHRSQQNLRTASAPGTDNAPK